MTRKSIYRSVLIVVLVISLWGLGAYGVHLLKESIPNNIRILAGTEEEFSFHFPAEAVVYEESITASHAGSSNIPTGQLHIESTDTLKLGSEDIGSYSVSCKLFGLIELKSIQVQVMNAQYLIPGGEPIGIYMETNGVLVIGTGVVNGTDGLNYEPAYNILQSGDYILAVNGEQIGNKKELVDKINECRGEDIIFDVRRRNEVTKLTVKPVMTAPDEYKVGIWVRDNTQGIGTLTYIDSNNGFGALGHGINDVDTSNLMQLKSGKLYNTEILSVIKGEKGTPGELAGVIHYNDSEVIGEINQNTDSGIFGTLDETKAGEIYNEPMEICLKQDVQTGPATILSSIDGEVKEYQIEIQEIHLNDNVANKGLILKVTDAKLLELTGGIVQGMSGSPIIQNGKLVGAVTHVFIQDSTSGFGIFIENMLQTQE